MRQLRFSVSVSSTRALTLLACAFLLLALAGQVYAQSGRKVPRRTESAPVQPPSNPEPPPAEQPAEPDKEKKGIPIMVARDLSGQVGSNFYIDVVVDSCARRLKESRSIEVSVGRGMNRKEASDAAKISTDRYILLLDIDTDMYSGRSDSDIPINFTLYAPGTGKIKSSGRVYLGSVRAGNSRGGVGVPLPGGRTSAAGFEYRLREAGKDIADRVISALDLFPTPGRN